MARAGRDWGTMASTGLGPCLRPAPTAPISGFCWWPQGWVSSNCCLPVVSPAGPSPRCLTSAVSALTDISCFVSHTTSTVSAFLPKRTKSLFSRWSCPFIQSQGETKMCACLYVHKHMYFNLKNGWKIKYLDFIHPHKTPCLNWDKPWMSQAQPLPCDMEGKHHGRCGDCCAHVLLQQNSFLFSPNSSRHHFPEPRAALGPEPSTRRLPLPASYIAPFPRRTARSGRLKYSNRPVTFQLGLQKV